MIFPICIPLLDAAAADRTVTVPLPAVGEWRVEAASWSPDSDGAVTADASDYRTLDVKQGSTVIASVNTTVASGASWVANTAYPLTMTKGPSQEFTGGTDQIKVVSTHTGSTGKVAKGVLMLHVRLLQATAFPSA